MSIKKSLFLSFLLMIFNGISFGQQYPISFSINEQAGTVRFLNNNSCPDKSFSVEIAINYAAGFAQQYLNFELSDQNGNFSTPTQLQILGSDFGSTVGGQYKISQSSTPNLTRVAGSSVRAVFKVRWPDIWQQASTIPSGHKIRASYFKVNSTSNCCGGFEDRRVISNTIDVVNYTMPTTLLGGEGSFTWDTPVTGAVAHTKDLLVPGYPDNDILSFQIKPENNPDPNAWSTVASYGVYGQGPATQNMSISFVGKFPLQLANGDFINADANGQPLGTAFMVERRIKSTCLSIGNTRPLVTVRYSGSTAAQWHDFKMVTFSNSTWQDVPDNSTSFCSSVGGTIYLQVLRTSAAQSFVGTSYYLELSDANGNFSNPKILSKLEPAVFTRQEIPAGPAPSGSAESAVYLRSSLSSFPAWQNNISSGGMGLRMKGIIPAGTPAGTYKVRIVNGNWYVASPEATVVVGACRVAVSGSDQEAVRVFPNPAKENVEIEVLDGRDSEFTVLSLSGKEILRGKLTDGKATIASKTLNSGTYLVKTIVREIAVSTKLVIQ
jgi:hypothetical protein